MGDGLYTHQFSEPAANSVYSSITLIQTTADRQLSELRTILEFKLNTQHNELSELLESFFDLLEIAWVLDNG